MVTHTRIVHWWTIAHRDVNADDAVSLGQRAMSNFKGGWPASSRQTSCHHGCEEETHVSRQGSAYDQEVIDARVIGLLATTICWHKSQLHIHHQCSEIKITKTISTLKLRFQVVILKGNCPIPETLIYDVSALLWVPTCILMPLFCLFIKLLNKMTITILVKWFLNDLDSLTWYFSHCVIYVYLIV